MGKEYGMAEAVEDLANKLIPSYHPELSTARIKYIYVDKASQKAGRPVLGKVRKISGALEFLLQSDFLVEVALETWNDLSPEQRSALVDHLLERCNGEEDDNSGEMKWRTREPDVHEFSSILQRHGAWNEELNGFVSIARTVRIDDMVNEVVGAMESVQES